MVQGIEGQQPWHVRALASLILLVLSLCLLGLRACSAHIKRVRKTNPRRRRALLRRLGLDDGTPWTILGFFHPCCNAGGGGERVLFEAIRHHLEQQVDAICVVYSVDVTASRSLRVSHGASTSTARTWPSSSSIADGGGTATKEEIIVKAKHRFDIDLATYVSRIDFLPLKSRELVADKYWKRLTMLGQSFGGVMLAREACEELIPDAFFDTMGYSFAFPVIRTFQHDCPIAAYVHYPTISTDMLRRVKSRQAGHTNNSAVAASAMRSQAKVVYYRLFAAAYTWALRRADVIVANGSWTRNHLYRLLLSQSAFDQTTGQPRTDNELSAAARHGRLEIVYPPCDTASFSSFSLANRHKHTFVSLAQFRPEKEHATQLRFLRVLLDRRPDLAKASPPLRLIMMGSSRNPEDEERVLQLGALCTELKLDEYVEFIVNAPYVVVLLQLSRASIGLSTMVDEHFGINIVEFMAAGLITLSHASAGPLLDIAVPTADPPDSNTISARKKNLLPTGYHATDVDDFAAKAELIVSLPAEEAMGVRRRARARAQETFSNSAFRRAWDEHLWQPLSTKVNQRTVDENLRLNEPRKEK